MKDLLQGFGEKELLNMKKNDLSLFVDLIFTDVLFCIQ